MTEIPPSGRNRSLARESGFWRKVRERKKLHDSDIFRLREDLQRLEDVVGRVTEGGTNPDLAKELREVQLTVEKDFGTMSLVLQTLIEILLQKEIMNEDEFEEKMDEIDLRDGKKDGALHSSPDSSDDDTTKE